MRLTARPDLNELVPFIRAIIAAIRPSQSPVELAPPDRGLLPPQPYREGFVEPPDTHCWCGQDDCRLPLPHRRAD